MRGHITKIAMSKYHIIIIIVGVVVLEMHLIPPKLFSLLYFHDFFLFPGLLCDLLWSDPDKDVQGWGENDRGVSFTFGADVVSKFLNRHDLDLICRAHQVNFEDFFFDQRTTDRSRLVWPQ